MGSATDIVPPQRRSRGFRVGRSAAREGGVPRHAWLWFGITLVVVTLLAWQPLHYALSNPQLVQDDVRQHGFWAWRYLDPTLFPNDLIADYFQSVAPLGYRLVYRGLAAFGIDPMLGSKLLPAGLMILTGAYGFWACLQLLPVPLTGFLAAVLLTLNQFFADDVLSGTPRAFLYPLFVAFLYYLLRYYSAPWRSPLPSLIGCGVTVGLLGVFYPQMMLIACGLLALLPCRWERWRVRLSDQPMDYWFCVLGLLVGGLAVGVYLLQGGKEFGPVVSAQVAAQMPEFSYQNGGGRARFFMQNQWAFWLDAPRSGFFPRFGRLLSPVVLVAGLVLPWLVRSPQRFPLAARVAQTGILTRMMLASAGLFLAAHLLLFRLHLPSRYTQHTLRLLLVFTASMALVIVLDALWRQLAQPGRWRSVVALVTVGLFVSVTLLYPAVIIAAQPNPQTLHRYRLLRGYIGGPEPELYQFFQQQPHDGLIASLTAEADNIPLFAQRSVLVSKEHGIPYHLGYYQQFRDRMTALITAHYSPHLESVRAFTNTYNIRFWLVQPHAFTPDYVASSYRVRHYPAATQGAIAQLQQGKIPVVQQAIPRCTVYQNPRYVVLDAQCVIEPPVLSSEN